MNIAMFTNAYEPVVGGLERSVAAFAEDLRATGHSVLIVTLAFPGAEESDEMIFRLPALKEIAGTEFSFRVPVPAGLKKRLDRFEPDIIHAHHPFMLGDTALRVARGRGLPLVFTHHTLYEQYTYQFAEESEALSNIAMTISTEYANLCDLVVAPTGSIRDLIRERGVDVPIEVVPTGVDVDFYGRGRGEQFRESCGIPQDAFVLGYLGRVVEAKNMLFLTGAVVDFLSECPDAWFLVVGDGDAMDRVRDKVRETGVADRVVMTGTLEGKDVADTYAAMDLFAFASHTETQGIVLVEAFCAGVPIVALDAPGTRDIIQHDRNGWLLASDADARDLAARIRNAYEDTDTRTRWSEAARQRARDFDRKHCAELLLSEYDNLIARNHRTGEAEPELWTSLQQRFSAEWGLFRTKLAALSSTMESELTSKG